MVDVGVRIGLHSAISVLGRVLVFLVFLFVLLVLLLARVALRS